MNIRRGGIYIANLDPVLGSETGKQRPVIIVSNDKNNEFASTLTVVPVTSGQADQVYPFEVFLPKGYGNLTKDSRVKCNQIRTIDKRRIISQIGIVSNDKMREIATAIKLHLDIADAYDRQDYFSGKP